MHILFVTYDVPYPPNSGGKTRAYNLIKYAKKDARISLFSFTRPGYDLSYLEELRKIGIDTIELFPRKSKKNLTNLSSFISPSHSIFHSLYFEHTIFETLFTFVKEQSVDLVQFESFYTGFYLSERIRELGVSQVYGSENIEYKLYEEGLQSVPQILRPIFRRETAKIRQEEIQMATRADAVFAVTGDEAGYFTDVSKTPSYVVPNGVAIQDFPSVPEKKHEKLKLLFIGNFNYFPNRDAITYFMRDVWPKLSHENFHLTVVGNDVMKQSLLSSPVIEKIEYIPDIYDVYSSTDVFISPMRYGGGTNFKVLEAMAAGLPVVALHDKSGSINATNEREICIARDSSEFVEYIEKLGENPEFRKNLGRSARELVLREYSWETIGKNVYTIWQRLCHEKN